jgi:hypothetical protein
MPSGFSKGIIWQEVAGLPGTVNLDGHNINHTTGAGTATAGIRFNTDGTVDQLKGATYTQIDSGTGDWLVSGTNDNLWEVRYTNRSGNLFDSSAAAENTWIAISAAREWYIQDTNPNDPTGTKNINCDFEIRYDGGEVLTTGTYIFTARYWDLL